MGNRLNLIGKKDRKWKRKRFLLVALILTIAQLIFSQNVKTVFIPDNLKIEENGAIEETVHNMTEEEIYRAHFMYMVDGFIYLAGDTPVEIIKLSLEGKILGRFGREGQGPGEFIWIGGINGFKGKIIILETKLQKIVIYSDKLKFIKEYKLKERFNSCLIGKNDRFILYGRTSANYYFAVFTGNLKFLREFAESVTSYKESMENFSFDMVRQAVYVPEKDGIWTTFRNRYDLQYYEKERLAIEIKAGKNYFKNEEQEIQGRKVKLYKDKSVHLAMHKDRLFYLYNKEKRTYCDVFDLSGPRIVKRIGLSFKYNRIVHYKENIFYAFRFAQNEDEDLLFVRLKIKI